MKKYCIAQLFCLAIFNLHAQDHKLLYPNTDLMALNPAFAGSNGGFRMQSNYFEQGQQAYFSASTDWYLKRLKSAFFVGTSINNYAHAIMKESTLFLGYARHFTLLDGKLKLIPALQLSYLQRSLDVNALNYFEVYDPRLHLVFLPTSFPTALPAAQKRCFDFTGGLVMQYNNKLSFGFSAAHINQPDIGMYGVAKLPARFLLHASYTIFVADDNMVNMYAHVSHQNQYNQFTANATLVLHRHFVFGLGCQVYQFNAAVVRMGYKGTYWTVNALYKYEFSKLAAGEENGLQLSLSANIGSAESRHRPIAIENW